MLFTMRDQANTAITKLYIKNEEFSHRIL